MKSEFDFGMSRKKNKKFEIEIAFSRVAHTHTQLMAFSSLISFLSMSLGPAPTQCGRTHIRTTNTIMRGKNNWLNRSDNEMMTK